MKNKTVQNTDVATPAEASRKLALSPETQDALTPFSKVEPPSSFVGKTDELVALPGGTERILLVEDEPPVRQLAVHVLRGLGYQVMEAASGVEALEIWKQECGRFDLLFADKVMPGGVSGLQLSQQLTQMSPGLPTIITSGYGVECLDELVGEKNVTFLGKPYKIVELAAVIRTVLDAESTQS